MKTRWIGGSAVISPAPALVGRTVPRHSPEWRAVTRRPASRWRPTPRHESRIQLTSRLMSAVAEQRDKPEPRNRFDFRDAAREFGPSRAGKPRLERVDDLALAAVFHRHHEGKTELLAIGAVPVAQLRELVRGAAVEAGARLLVLGINRQRARRRLLAGELGVRPDQRELRLGRRCGERSDHPPMQCVNACEWPRRIRALSDPRRVLEDVAQCGHKIILRGRRERREVDYARGGQDPSFGTPGCRAMRWRLKPWVIAKRL